VWKKQRDTSRSKHLPVKGLIDNRCHALEAVPERRAINKLNAYFFIQKIKSECKYSMLKTRVVDKDVNSTVV